MAIDSIFNCGFSQCLMPCLITFAVTLFILAIINIIIYFKLVAMAKKRFGIENFFGQNNNQIKH
jgi:hypothetical protein